MLILILGCLPLSSCPIFSCEHHFLVSRGSCCRVPSLHWGQEHHQGRLSPGQRGGQLLQRALFVQDRCHSGGACRSFLSVRSLWSEKCCINLHRLLKHNHIYIYIKIKMLYKNVTQYWYHSLNHWRSKINTSNGYIILIFIQQITVQKHQIYQARVLCSWFKCFISCCNYFKMCLKWKLLSGCHGNQSAHSSFNGKTRTSFFSPSHLPSSFCISCSALSLSPEHFRDETL